VPASTLRPARSWWRRSRWLLARRASQLLVLGLFMLGPWAGLWLARGTLASSELLGVLRLTDPLVAPQTLFARHALESSMLVGAAIVAVAQPSPVDILRLACLISGQRSAAWLRDAAAARCGGARPDRRLRYAVPGLALACRRCGQRGLGDAEPDHAAAAHAGGPLVGAMARPGVFA
jgi:ferredoxin-type protein NapH